MWKRYALRLVTPILQERILEAVMDLPDVTEKAQAITLLKSLKRYIRIRGHHAVANVIPFEVD